MLEPLVFLKKVGESVWHPETGELVLPGIVIEGTVQTICVEFDRDIIFSEPFYREAKIIIDKWLNERDNHAEEFRGLVFLLQAKSRELCDRKKIFSAKARPSAPEHPRSPQLQGSLSTQPSGHSGSGFGKR
jgi:hypothetical protein